MLKKQIAPKSVMSILLIAGVNLALLSGCSTPPKPKELNELEGILQAPDALEIRDTPGAGKYYREARQYRQVSLKAYEQKNLDDAREYAILGTMRFRTAAAIKKQVEEAKRLEAANEKIVTLNPTLKALQDEREKLKNEVSSLERTATQRRQAHENRMRGGSSAERLAARNRIDAAKKAQGEALRVKADEFAEDTFNRANNMLESAQRLYDADGGSARDIQHSAEQALTLFRQARSEAEPEYQKQQDPEVRRRAVHQEAAQIFGAPYVMPEPNGVRVILAMTFDKGETEVRNASRAQVISAAKLAGEYDDAALVIEGYTRSGDPTENLSISDNRARTVRDIFVNEGIKKSRISTRGQGQNMQRYADDPSANDRVEVILTFSR